MANGGELFWKFVNDDGEDPIRFPFARLCLSLMDIPAKFFLENLCYIFHERALCTGTPSVLGRRVDLRALRRTALMTIEGGYDDISGPGQTHAAQILCSSVPAHRRAHLFVPGSGHFSLFYGQTWRQTVLPSMTAFWHEAA
jgi:poly(3-hydroxybutyrate) depolymerase